MGSNADWRLFGFSVDGTKIVAALGSSLSSLYYQSVLGYCFYSTNSGLDWQAPGNHYGDCGWSQFAMSADGKHILSLGGSTLLNTSTNYGMNWVQTSIPGVGGPQGYPNVASSSDIKTLVVAKAGAPISISTNSAVTWTAMDSFPLQWSAIAGSADASKLVAVSLDGGIFTYQSLPSLNINIVSGAAVLSWSASGADFQLQQTTDLHNSNWIPVTNAPFVVNGKSQVTLPVSDQNFFRLKSR
jgi:hypothetical protein